MEDGLYFYGAAGWIWVAEISFVMNFQANDLTSPDTLELSYTNQFTLPNSLAIQKLLNNAEQLDAGGEYPYKFVMARAIEEDEIIFDGRAELKNFQAGWKVVIYEAHRGFFDRIADKNIRDLDLSRLDHPWTLDEINARAGATEGVTYPALDYGTVSDGIIPQDTIFPAVFVRTVVDQILQEEGYKAVGSWVNDPLYKAMAYPFTEAEPIARDQQWIDDRTARVTVATVAPTVMFGGVLNRIQPFTIDNRTLDGWVDGKANCFNTSTYSYVADASMRLNVVAVQFFNVKITVGTVEVKLQLEKNGAFVEQAYWSKKTGYNLILNKIDELTLDTTILVKKGDSLKIRLIVQKKTLVAEWQAFIINDPDSVYASFIPDATIRTGDNWLTAQNLPNLKSSEVLKALAFKYGGWYRINNSRRTVELVKLTTITNNRANAVDWSAKVEESADPEVRFQIDPYAQRNLLKWKEQSGVDKGYGDGVIRCDKSLTLTEKTLFELPYAATMPSTRQVSGYGYPLLIETRTVTGAGDTLQINKTATGPRIILVEPTKTFEVSTQVLNGAGAIVPAKVTLTGCWFARRDFTIITNENEFSLAFDPVSGQISEISLIGRHYDGLKRVLRRPRMLLPSIFLKSVDVATLDPSLPIRIRNVKIGELELTDGYYYLNGISNYQSGVTCTATLIAF